MAFSFHVAGTQRNPEVGTSGGAPRVPHIIWVDVDSYFSKAYVLGTRWDQTSWSISWALIIDLGRGANLGAWPFLLAGRQWGPAQQLPSGPGMLMPRERKFRWFSQKTGLGGVLPPAHLAAFELLVPSQGGRCGDSRVALWACSRHFPLAICLLGFLSPVSFLEMHSWVSGRNEQQRNNRFQVFPDCLHLYLTSMCYFIY